MGIKLVEDVAIPGAVVAAHFGTEYADQKGYGGETAISPIVGTIMFAAGYALTGFGIGGDYTKNMGIAAMDWGVRSIKEMVEARGLATRSLAVKGDSESKLSMRPRTRIGRYPAPVAEDEFQGVKLT